MIHINPIAKFHDDFSIVKMKQHQDWLEQSKHCLLLKETSNTSNTNSV